jgi:hypothetical protein
VDPTGGCGLRPDIRPVSSARPLESVGDVAKQLARVLVPIACFAGWLVAFQMVVLLYNQRTFGSVFRTGYNFWVRGDMTTFGICSVSNMPSALQGEP